MRPAFIDQSGLKQCFAFPVWCIDTKGKEKIELT